MKLVYRLYFSLAILLLFCYFFCYWWLESWSAQLIALTVILLAAGFSMGIRKLTKELWLLLPFIAMLAAIYGFLAIFAWGYSRAYWIQYGLTRSSLLISSLLLMQILISRIKLNEFLFLPWKIQKLKYIILGKLLYSLSVNSYPELCQLTELIPSEQELKPNLRKRIRSKLITLLALISLIIGEATRKGEMIDACILHCHPKEKI